jgi:hypothetical protein
MAATKPNGATYGTRDPSTPASLWLGMTGGGESLKLKIERHPERRPQPESRNLLFEAGDGVNESGGQRLRFGADVQFRD